MSNSSTQPQDHPGSWSVASSEAVLFHLSQRGLPSPATVTAISQAPPHTYSDGALATSRSLLSCLDSGLCDLIQSLDIKYNLEAPEVTSVAPTFPMSPKCLLHLSTTMSRGGSRNKRA